MAKLYWPMTCPALGSHGEEGLRLLHRHGHSPAVEVDGAQVEPGLRVPLHMQCTAVIPLDHQIPVPGSRMRRAREQHMREAMIVSTNTQTLRAPGHLIWLPIPIVSGQSQDTSLYLASHLLSG